MRAPRSPIRKGTLLEGLHEKPIIDSISNEASFEAIAIEGIGSCFNIPDRASGIFDQLSTPISFFRFSPI
jgi:hypothetical protein